MRSAAWAASLAAVALAGAGARWLAQGSRNLYTAVAKRFYEPDPDFGWRVAAGGPLWLGLDAIAAVLGLGLAVLVAGLLVSRREKRTGRRARALRAALWVVAAAPLVLPVWAFATGTGPAGGREALPEGASAPAPTSGIEGALPLPAGRYEVVASPGTAVTAKLEAGKEAFEARFERGITGTWTADPGDLRKPMKAEIGLDAGEVDTGVPMRSNHARGDYLEVDKYPRITLELGRLVAARQDGPTQLAFRSEGSLALLGETVAVELTGTLRAPDEAGRARLGVSASDAVALVEADLTLTVGGTRLREHADSFDADRIPIHVTLVLVRRGDPAP
ncbi:MAG: YceI family protein [Myxococcales bacterium]|nr:YceI family protein [Myxococcales bacterium]